MKLKIDRDALADAVTWTARTCPARSAVPVLTGIRLDADSVDSTLTLAAFDYEQSARTTIDAGVSEGGSVLASGKLLADICRSLPSRPVTLTLDGTRLKVTSGSSKFVVPTMPIDDYPALPEAPAPIGTIAGGVFAHAVTQVAMAAARDETPPMLGGVLLEWDGPDLSMIATDRYRLALRDIPWKPAEGTTTGTALIRAKTIAEIAKTMGGSEITIAVSDNIAAFEAAGRTSTSIVIDAKYPAVRSLLPADCPATADVDRETLIEAGRRVGLVVGQGKALRCSFTPDSLTIDGGDGEDAQASETIPCDYISPPGSAGLATITMGFNPAFLLDGLNAITSPKVRFHLTAPKTPTVLTGITGDTPTVDGTYRYLLMPVRL